MGLAPQPRSQASHVRPRTVTRHETPWFVRSNASIAGTTAAHPAAHHECLHEGDAIGIHPVALLFAHHVAIAVFPTVEQRKTLLTGQTGFELHFAFLRQTQIARFYRIRTRARRRAKCPRTTARNGEFGKTCRVQRETPTWAIRHVRRAHLEASNERKTRRFVCTIAISQLTLLVQATAASFRGFCACRRATTRPPGTSQSPTRAAHSTDSTRATHGHGSTRPR